MSETRKPIKHTLKILPQFYKDILSGEKTFEVRKNDRDFRVGDYLALAEWDKEYTGRGLMVKITYILNDTEWCKEGYVIIGFGREV